MRRFAISPALILAASVSATAADITRLQAAMGQLPESVLTAPDPLLARFVDMAVLRDQTDGNLAPSSVGRVRLGGAIRALEALGIAGPEAWSERAGAPVESVDYFLGFGQTPETMTIWGLSSPAAAGDLMTALGERDFVPIGEGVLGNGEPMVADLAIRDPANPWRSMIGAASFVAQDGSVIVQGDVPQAVAAHKLIARAADHAIVKTMLAGLAEAGSNEPIVQAMLVSPIVGIRGIDPATLMTGLGDVDAIKDKLLEQIEVKGDGLPPYLSAIVADLASDRPAVVIALAYADCGVAEEAAELLSKRWPAAMPDTARGALVGRVTPGADQLCAATLTITAEEEVPSGNPIFDAVLNELMSGTFTIFQIGALQTGEMR